MFTYDINIESAGEYLWAAQVTIIKNEVEIFTGETLVSCDTEEEAIDYVEKVYMKDIRANNQRSLSEMILSWEAPPEEPIEEVIEEEAEEEIEEVLSEGV